VDERQQGGDRDHQEKLRARQGQGRAAKSERQRVPQCPVAEVAVRAQQRDGHQERNQRFRHDDAVIDPHRRGDRRDATRDDPDGLAGDDPTDEHEHDDGRSTDERNQHTLSHDRVANSSIIQSRHRVAVNSPAHLARSER
jgi:hypothetical protein